MTIKRWPGLAVAYMFLGTSMVLAADCTPSRWGADDEIGSANLISPERVISAAGLIKKGRSHPLGVVIDSKTPAFPPRSLSLQVVQPGQHNNRDMTQDFGWPVIYNDDVVQMWNGIGSQLDGLGHMGEVDSYYNCNKASDFVHIEGLKKLGTHQVPPLVGRGVLIDMAAHFGKEMLPAGHGITDTDIKAAAEQQGIKIRIGDVVLFHTGWTEGMLEKDPAAWVAGEPGLTNAAAVYLADLDPLAVGADTWGLDVSPPITGDKVFYGHVELLMHHGIYILETMNTGPLVREGVKEFMFVLGQPRIRGAVQAQINPVAIW
jgi:kynurenine formamidase